MAQAIPASQSGLKRLQSGSHEGSTCTALVFSLLLKLLDKATVYCPPLTPESV